MRQAVRPAFDIRLAEQIHDTDYVSKKLHLVNHEVELKSKLEAFENNRRNRFELSLGGEIADRGVQNTVDLLG